MSTIEQLPQRQPRQEQPEEAVAIDTAAINAEQIAAQAQADQLETEMNGAYSSLGNRHTYAVDAETGKKQVVKREEALNKADELNGMRSVAAGDTNGKSWAEMSDGEQLAKAKLDGYKDAYIDRKSDTLIQGKKTKAPKTSEEIDQIQDKKQARIDARAIRNGKDTTEPSQEADQAEETRETFTARELLNTWVKAIDSDDKETAAHVADEIEDMTGVVTEEDMSNAEHRAELEAAPAKLAAVLRQKSAAGLETEAKKAKPSEEFDSLIKAWALAEKNNDAEGAQLAQDKLQQIITAGQENGLISEDKIADLIKEMNIAKEAHLKMLRTEDKPAQKLYDYEEMVKEPVVETTTVEAVDVESEEEVAKEAGMIAAIKARFTSIKEKVGERLTTRKQKIAVAAGAVALVAGGMFGAYLMNTNDGGSSEGDAPLSELFENDDIEAGASSTSEVANPANQNIDVSQYSWDVANQLSPGNEGSVIQGAVDRYNEAHGTGFALTPHNGSTWIMDGARAISPAEMAELNNLMQAA